MAENRTGAYKERIESTMDEQSYFSKHRARLIDSIATMLAFSISVLGVGTISKVFNLSLNVLADAVLIVGVIHIVTSINTIIRLLKETECIRKG